MIRIDGVIGADVLPSDIRAQLADAGDQVDIEINSPGGFVHDGIDIANALRDYRRNGGRVSATVTGLAASMATYIAMFADRLAVEDNAVFMVHNPSTIALGDYRDMRKSAAILESLQGVLANAYVAKTGRDRDAIRAEMDNETWLFGDEIVAEGYADALVPAGDGAEDRLSALALANTAFAAMRRKLKEQADDSAAMDQIAALLPRTAAPAANTEDTTMTDTAPAAVETPEPAPVDETAIRAEAVEAERARIAAITALCAKVRLPHLAQALIDRGADLNQARAEVIDHWAEQGGAEIRQSAQSVSGTSDIDVAAIQRRIYAQVAGRQQA